MWQLDEIAEAIAGAVRAEDRRLHDERSPYGVDALDEVGLHPLVREALAGAGYGVYSERPYPGEQGAPGRRPIRRERERCDLVLTASPDVKLVDPVITLAEDDAAAGTLFAAALPEREPARGTIAEPEEALWIEVKLVGQQTYTQGVPGPNATYASELLRLTAGDLDKLSKDRRIVHGVLLLILMCESEEVGRHDVHEATRRWLDRGLLAGLPVIRVTPIAERIGNAACLIALAPAARRAAE